MREAQIRAAAQLLGVKADASPPNTAGWMSVGCPFAPWLHENEIDRKPSMRVHVADGALSHWKCWACDAHGDLTALLYRLRSLGAELPYAQLMDLANGEGDDLVFPSLAVEVTQYVPPPALPEDWLKSFLPIEQASMGLDYMLARGVTIATLRDWDVRWDFQGKRVCVPIRDYAGVLRGIQGRTVINAEPKYFHYPYRNQAPRGNEFWMGEHRLDLNKPVVPVEGFMDGFAVYPVYPNVAINMGSATLLNMAKLDRLATAFAVVPFFDADKTGGKALHMVETWCKGKRLCVPVSPPQGRDPGDLSDEKIADLLGPALAKAGAFG